MIAHYHKNVADGLFDPSVGASVLVRYTLGWVINSDRLRRRRQRLAGHQLRLDRRRRH